jgi:protein-S-isoprenylcysteine O-methyltransferase Ste14
MDTKLLMSSSAISLAIIGLGMTFFPKEIADKLLLDSTVTFQLILQVLGALYFAFAMLNWMAKGNAMGGIYNRPIVIANVAHYLIGGLALMKGLINHPDLPWAIWVMAGLYFIFALFFGILLFRSPVKK